MGYVILNLSKIPLWHYAIAVVLLVSIFLFTKKISISLVIPYMLLVLAATTLARSSYSIIQYDFTPFASYKRAALSRDIWWQVACNVGMSIPIGILLPFTIKNVSSSGKKLLITLAIGTTFSVYIEILQFILHRGYSETDDVISSVIGLIVGFVIYSLFKVIIKTWVRKEKLLYKNYVKRLLDILTGLGVLILLWPVLLITAIAIKIESPGPVIFRQKRIGYKTKVFEIYKFRSMRVNSEHTGSGVYSNKNDSRVTRVGRIIRATSIDELPQAVNMLMGDMSLIGPRPPLTYHPWPIDEYTKEQLRMFDVRPGITGWAQINGRKDVEWHKRIQLNNWYVDHVSFRLDMKIFIRTIYKVLTNADNENKEKTVNGR